MRKTLRKALVGLSAVAMLGAMTVPAMAAGESDPTTTTIEPILTRSDGQVNDARFRTAALGEINIKSFDLRTDGDEIIGTVETQDTILRCTGTPPARTCNITPVAPYGGSHIMIMFQTPQMNQITNIGCADLTCTRTTGWTPLHPNDNFYWAFYYGVTVNGGEPDYGLAWYDATGRLGGFPLEPGIGQVFHVMGQANNGKCIQNAPGMGDLPTGAGNNASFSYLAGNKVEFRIPYTYKWRTAACVARSKAITATGGDITNAVAFSWADHEIGGPDPVGLILGWTWYTDSVPALLSGKGYNVGTPAGDPNPGRIALHNCPVMISGVNGAPGGLDQPRQVNPLWNAASQCTIDNPVGPGFIASGINQKAL